MQPNAHRASDSLHRRDEEARAWTRLRKRLNGLYSGFKTGHELPPLSQLTNGVFDD